MATQAYNPLSRRPRLALMAASALVVLTLALLNPLMCLLHCAQVSALPGHAAALPNGFLCVLGAQHRAAPSPTSAPPADAPIAPRAFYESLLPALGELALVLVVGLLLRSVALRLTQVILRPATPPPRLLLVYR